MIESVDKLIVEKLRGPIITRRLILRWPVRDDLRAISLIINDPIIARNTASIRYPFIVRSGWNWLSGLGRLAHGRTHVAYALTLRSNPHLLVGVIGVDITLGKTPEIGYWLAKSERGKGLAPEAARALIGKVFENTDATAITASARKTNSASQRVLKKSGMRKTGYGQIKSRQFARYLPVIYFKISRRDWETGKSLARP